MPVEMWDEPRYWFCLKHSTVEDEAGRCRSDQRLGPFATAQEAAGALGLARRRTEAWEAEEAADDEA